MTHQKRNPYDKIVENLKEAERLIYEMTQLPLDPFQGFGIGGQYGPHRRASQTVGGNPYAQSNSGNPGWAQVLPIYGTVALPTSSTAFPTCDYTGTRPRKGTNLRAGEIVAFRAWRVRPTNRLFSVAFDGYEWFPGEPAEGDPDIKLDNEFAAGVHAFKDFKSAEEYIWRCCCHAQIPYVLGEVALWGTVHEHSLGYRAQFAKPTKFQLLYRFPETNLEALRARFGIEEKS